MRLRCALGLFLLVVLAVRARADSLVIRNAQLADGSGGPLRRGDVRVQGDRIAAIGTFRPGRADRVIEAEGLILAPGFIDVHNHSMDRFEEDLLAPSQISQGITTVLLGQDGNSPWPISAYLDKRRSSPATFNVLVLVGHSTLRRMVLGEDARRPAREEEITRMARLVAQGMQQGAIGLSSNLTYAGSSATTEEVVALARVAAQYGGVYVPHIRNEGPQVFEAVEEAILIGERAKVPVQITHLKISSPPLWGRTPALVRLIEEARGRGVDVTADCYAHYEWPSNIGGPKPDEWAGRAFNKIAAGAAGEIIVLRCPKRPEYEARSLEAIAGSRGISATEVLREIERDGGARVLGPIMRQADVRLLFQQPWVMFASDGGIALWEGAPERMHIPRDTGTYPRILGRYVREQEWLGIAEAVRKMTGLPASHLKLKDRGIIREGAAADLVLFNPATVKDRSTWLDPSLPSEGIERVIVNGQTVWDGEKPTGARPGRALRR